MTTELAALNKAEDKTATVALAPKSAKNNFSTRGKPAEIGPTTEVGLLKSAVFFAR